MKPLETASSRPAARSRQQTRLAQRSIAAVDVSASGMMHLHIGALTLRMAPCAVSELLATLGQAVAAQAGREARALGLQDGAGVFVRDRGDA